MVTVSILGGAIVSATGLFLGVSAAWEKSAAVRRIFEAKGVEAALRREICGRLSPLPAAVSRVRAEFPSCAFLAKFERLGAERGYENAPDCWREALSSGNLRGEALEALYALAPVIGRYDQQEQKDAFDELTERLEGIYRAAHEQNRAMGRVYVTLGICGGAALAILLG